SVHALPLSCFHQYLHPPDLPSFPTRRSSDLPPETLAAFRDHGRPRPSLETDLTEAMDTLDDLDKAGISLREVTGDLLADEVVERSEEHTSELQSRGHLVCRLLLEKKKNILIG